MYFPHYLTKQRGFSMISIWTSTKDIGTQIAARLSAYCIFLPIISLVALLLLIADKLGDRQINASTTRDKKARNSNQQT